MQLNDDDRAHQLSIIKFYKLYSKYREGPAANMKDKQTLCRLFVVLFFGITNFMMIIINNHNIYYIKLLFFVI